MCLQSSTRDVPSFTQGTAGALMVGRGCGVRTGRGIMATGGLPGAGRLARWVLPAIHSARPFRPYVAKPAYVLYEIAHSRCRNVRRRSSRAPRSPGLRYLGLLEAAGDTAAW